MKFFVLFVPCLVFCGWSNGFSKHMNPVEEIFKWKTFSYLDFPKSEHDTIGGYPYFVRNNMNPTSVVYHDKTGLLIMAMPRVKPGVISTLNFIDFRDTYHLVSPRLKPFPNFELNELKSHYFHEESLEEDTFYTDGDDCVYRSGELPWRKGPGFCGGFYPNDQSLNLFDVKEELEVRESLELDEMDNRHNITKEKEESEPLSVTQADDIKPHQITDEIKEMVTETTEYLSTINYSETVNTESTIISDSTEDISIIKVTTNGNWVLKNLQKELFLQRGINKPKFPKNTLHIEIRKPIPIKNSINGSQIVFENLSQPTEKKNLDNPTTERLTTINKANIPETTVKTTTIIPVISTIQNVKRLTKNTAVPNLAKQTTTKKMKLGQPKDSSQSNPTKDIEKQIESTTILYDILPAPITTTVKHPKVDILTTTTSKVEISEKPKEELKPLIKEKKSELKSTERPLQIITTKHFMKTKPTMTTEKGTTVISTKEDLDQTTEGSTMQIEIESTTKKDQNVKTTTKPLSKLQIEVPEKIYKTIPKTTQEIPETVTKVYKNPMPITTKKIFNKIKIPESTSMKPITSQTTVDTSITETYPKIEETEKITTETPEFMSTTTTKTPMEKKELPVRTSKDKQSPTSKRHTRKPKRTDIRPLSLVSVYQLFLDKCDRLWFVDTGVLEYKNDVIVVQAPSLWVVDISDKCRFLIIKRHEFSSAVVKNGAGFQGITVDVRDDSCSHSRAYIANQIDNSIVVYDLESEREWFFNHKSFLPNMNKDSLINVEELTVDIQIGINTLTLGWNDHEGHPYLYYFPFTSTSQYAVSTGFLKEKFSPHYYPTSAFKHIGDRGPFSQSQSIVFDKETGVFFFAEAQTNSIRCWNARKTLKPTNIGIVFEDGNLIFPAHISIDSQGSLWVLSNKYPSFLRSGFKHDDYNVHLYRIDLKNAIKGTACDYSPSIYEYKDRIFDKIKFFSLYEPKHRQPSFVNFVFNQ